LFSQSSDVPHLTGLRAVAALMVMFLHLSQMHGHFLENYLVVVEHGYLGVDIFFVLSGFILSHVYAASFQNFSLRTYCIFLWRRFARLYPVHIATLSALVFMVGLRGLLDTNFWILSEIPRHLLIANAWTDNLAWNIPAWSISAEWLVYILFPLFVWLLLQSKTLIIPCLICLGLLVGFQFFAISEGGIVRSFMTWPAFWRVISEFALGVLGFRLAHNLKTSTKLDWLAIILFATIFINPIEILRVVTIAIFVAVLARSDGFLCWILSTRVALYLGTISYSIYMAHYPLIKVFMKLEDTFGVSYSGPVANILLVVALAIITICISVLLYHVVEAPARRWLRRREGQLF
jgi:peptidoglycan/LPS O-acetylase OafA/YrhL